MKHIIVFIVLQIAVIYHCQAQNEHPLLDSMESVFQTNFKGAKLFCSWYMELKHKAKGPRYFVNSDSTYVEVDYYKLNSLSFFYPGQTYYETANAYYSWMSGKTDNWKTVGFLKWKKIQKMDLLFLKLKIQQGHFTA